MKNSDQDSNIRRFCIRPDKHYEQNHLSFLDEAIYYYINSSNTASTYLKTIYFLSLQVEQTIKKELLSINPAFIFKEINDDVINYLKNVSTKKPTKLYSVERPARRPHSADVTLLISRYFKLRFEQDNYRPYLENLFKIRNEIVHPDPIYDIEINLIETNICITEAFRFIKLNNKYIFNKDKWEEVEQINALAEDELKQVITKKILAARNRVLKIPEKIQEILTNTPIPLKGYWDSTEEEHSINIICPACKRYSMNLVLGPETWDHFDEEVEQRYSFVSCRVCNLSFREMEYKEIIINPEEYELPKNWGENIYSIVTNANIGKILPPDPPINREFL